MKRLWDNLYPWYSKFEKAQKILLALDYDGTLTPIVSRPEQAKLNPQTAALLKKLSQNPKITLCIVTGRPLSEIKRLIGIKKAIYIANHGFEIASGKKVWTHPKAKKLKPLYKKILRDLHIKLHHIPRILIEDKGATCTIHYRNVSDEHIRSIKSTLQKNILAHIHQVTLKFGKKVFEIRPNIQWDKGTALLKVISAKGDLEKSLKIYMGDDLTDEDVFRILTSKDLSIRVGFQQPSDALFYIDTPQEVLLFLKILQNLISVR